ncbi:MAG: ABC transporter permease [Acidobacteriota bacterium]
METLLRDIRLAFRHVLRRPRTSVLVVLCATLAIGLNATIFSLVSAVAFFEPAADDPDQLVRLYSSHPGFAYASLSYPNYVDLREQNEVLTDLTAYSVAAANVSVDGRNERLPTVLASGNYFETLGVRAARGRVFTAADDVDRMGHPVAVIGDRFWRTRFGADPDVIGRTMLVNSEPITIIGVTPPEWRGTFPGLVLDLWLPMQMQPLLQPAQPNVLEARGMGWLMSAGRIKPGLDLEQVQAGLDVTSAALAAEYPRFNDTKTVLAVRGVVPFPPSFQRVLEMGSFAMLFLVACVLLIACANIAGLLLARAEERRREIGIRLAIGAGRPQLLRQLLLESAVLAGLGGVFGTLLAVAASRAFPSLFPSLGGLPVSVNIAPDLRVYGATLALTLVTGLVFGLLPALSSTRWNLVTALKAQSEGGRSRIPMRQVLVGFQVAVSMMLLITAGLFVSSLQNERGVELGYDDSGVLLAGLDPSLHGYGPEEGLRFFEALRDKVASTPGVESVAFGEMVPLNMIGNQQQGIEVEGYDPAQGERMNIDYNVVSEGYFETLGLRLEEGRGFSRSDGAESRPVVVINRALANRYWPDQAALGSQLWTGDEWREVVGITVDAQITTRRGDPQPHFYVPLRQWWVPEQRIHVKAAGDAIAMVPSVRRAVAELDPSVALYDLRTMDRHLEESLLLQKLATHLVALFGGLALVLASVGLFGLLMHAVVARRREIGIRMSVGAQMSDVFALIVRQGLLVVTVGMGFGAVGAAAAGRGLGGLLYGVQTVEPKVYLYVCLVLVTTALVAISVPALRATRVDPITALRQD